MVIFIEAIQGLKKDFKTSRDSDSENPMRQFAITANLSAEVVATTGLYWSMTESGLSLLAACLPTLYALSNAQRVKGIIDSFQTSLLRSSKKISAESKGSNNSMDSHIEMVPGAAGLASTDSCDIKDLDQAISRLEPANGQILIKKTFVMTENMV
ncbi:hypothetical protein MMC12_003663 [Toensbergia leucococca]|nr:hypothetical protein [Toensbergia leucococca]